MPMEVKTDEPPKQSSYVAAGSPTACFLPSCHKPFQQSCVRGKDGHFYCSPACAEIGGKLDLSRVEELRHVPAIPTPKQKLSWR
jgi:hypothetical protein